MPTEKQELLVSELVGPLSMHFRRGEAAYQNFHADGRQFLFAKILRDNNCQVRDLILSKGHLLPFEQQQKRDRISRTFRYLVSTVGASGRN